MCADLDFDSQANITSIDRTGDQKSADTVLSHDHM